MGRRQRFIIAMSAGPSALATERELHAPLP
jgi:hypothetical protein